MELLEQPFLDFTDKEAWFVALCHNACRDLFGNSKGIWGYAGAIGLADNELNEWLNDKQNKMWRMADLEGIENDLFWEKRSRIMTAEAALVKPMETGVASTLIFSHLGFHRARAKLTEDERNVRVNFYRDHLKIEEYRLGEFKIHGQHREVHYDYESSGKRLHPMLYDVLELSPRSRTGPNDFIWVQKFLNEYRKNKDDWYDAKEIAGDTEPIVWGDMLTPQGMPKDLLRWYVTEYPSNVQVRQVGPHQ